ncbi:hypothetical protein F0562_006734 [Nyssa sinensis]|uniref:Uncharacterized protein n=1 Tax=Nyssa sinensis TaxID=561372 RepID=A0A5J5AP98_9ASTE|nr:hypothetical protein F0562_006734 [Nyssa sinensis]
MSTPTHFSFLFLLLVVSSFSQCHADPYEQKSPPAPPPPEAAAGKEFPQSFSCNDPFTKCFGNQISCPNQCPSFKPSDSNTKGCYIDCNSKNCEAICKKRRTNCDGIGSACYDPRFVGGDGVMFYFHGKTNEHFSLVSDNNLQINARFIGRRPEGRLRDNTWIQALGLMFDSNTFTMAANKVAKWDNEVDQFLYSYNGVPAFYSTRTSRNLGGPRQPPCSGAYGEFKFFHLSEEVEGVLGQTYRPEFQNPVKRGVPMPIMGGEDKYKTSSLVSANCKLCIFGVDASRDASKSLVLDPAAMTVDCTSKMSNGRGFICRR